ncbi:MAG TPA: response regulator [Xanthomonadales bacterium]|nr:response regulator [Xanthomonadales bacterium]
MNTQLKKVLVIDDDAVVGQSFDRVLTPQGYKVNTALSGEEALHQMDDQDFDVVFTDIKMPGMNGLEVTGRIRERCPWTPVVVITGYGTDEYEAEAKVLGTRGFVRKPLTPEMIESITLKALEPDTTAAEAQTEPEADTTPATERNTALKNAGLFAKNVGLFIAAPFIGLAYVIALPFVFFGMAAKLGYRALKDRDTRS